MVNSWFDYTPRDIEERAQKFVRIHSKTVQIIPTTAAAKDEVVIVFHVILYPQLVENQCQTTKTIPCFFKSEKFPLMRNKLNNILMTQ